MWLRYISLCFIFNGFIGVAAKMVHEAGFDQYRATYLIICSCTALVFVSVFLAVKKKIPARKDIIVGSIMGIFWVAAITSALLALSKLPGIIYFPVLLTGNIVLTCFVSRIFWKEKLGLNGILGITFALVSVFLLTT